MKFDIKLTANSDNLFQEKENQDLTLVNGIWNKEIDIQINNPYSLSTENIVNTEYPLQPTQQ